MSYHTLSPASTNFSATAAPIPELAPVTIATFPCHLSIESTILLTIHFHDNNNCTDAIMQQEGAEGKVFCRDNLLFTCEIIIVNSWRMVLKLD